MKLNVEKSHVVIFKKGNRSLSDKWYFDGNELNVSTNMSYLGLNFTSNGSFHQMQSTLASQASKAVFILYKRINSFCNLTPAFMMDLFEKFIMPILCYGCEIWGFHPAPHIERIQLQFCKRILGVKKTTQNDFVYGELGRMPVQNIRFARIIKYWLLIVIGKKSYYVTVLYNALLNSVDVDNKPSWVKSVKSLLCRIGLGEAWFNQGVGDIKCFMSCVKLRLSDIHKQEWSGRLHESTRARFYRAIRSDFEHRSYLDDVIPHAHRVALARLLTSSHLPVATRCTSR